jgi:hypothetical protein
MQGILRTVALLVAIIAAGCATGSASNPHIPEAHPRVIAARVQNAGWSQKDAHRASALYALKCGRCHKFYDPAAYDEDDWKMWFRKMSKKANLEPAQQQTLSDYLAAARTNTTVAK